MEFKKSPFVQIPTIKIDIRREVDAAGNVILQSAIPLKKNQHRTVARLLKWARETPDRVFLAQRDTSGAWQSLTYAETLQRVKNIAQFLLNSPVSIEKPLAILSENSIEHGLMALAAQYIGVPYSPIATAYSLKSTDYAKLRHVLEVLTPGLIFVQQAAEYAPALRAVAPGVDLIAVHGAEEPSEGLTFTAFEQVINTPATNAVAKAFNQIQPETIAKILFTSGSTGLPKGVINTHGNITTNWQQITQTFPLMKNGGLTLVDWLPWNHTFGGNHNFGLTLYNGGSLYIDGGNPTPKGIETTLNNLRDIAPTVYFNVPKGFEELVNHLRQDADLRLHFFSQLKLLFYAGAGMPQHVWDALEELTWQTTGKRLMISSGLGMTEASPSAMFNTHWGSFAGMLGVPVPGLQVKLVPNGGKLEARFKGSNITPGYWRNPTATAAVFDEDGFYCTGDALKYLDPENPNAGMVFDGRIAEDFKLDTGTWVNVGVLKARFIAAGQGLIQDAAITGHDRPFLGAIVFPELNYCKKLADLADDVDLEVVVQAPPVRAALQKVLNQFASQNTGSSTLIKRAIFADFTLSIDKGEITDKGSINQRMILANRAAYVEQLYEKEVRFPVLEVE